MTLNIIIAKEGAKARTKATKEAKTRQKKAQQKAKDKLMDEKKTQKLKREGATLQKQVDKMSDNRMATVLANPNEFSKEEVKIAKAKFKLENVSGKEGPKPRPKSVPKPKSKPKSTPRGLTAGSDPETGATRGFEKYIPDDLLKPKGMPYHQKMFILKYGPNGKKMAYGGMSGGKRHMYVAGGSVKDNPGLIALGKASPKAFKNITGKDPSGN